MNPVQYANISLYLEYCLMTPTEEVTVDIHPVLNAHFILNFSDSNSEGSILTSLIPFLRPKQNRNVIL